MGKILIVEDDLKWTNQYRDWFVRKGIPRENIESVISAEEAETFLTEKEYIAVLTDGLNGGWERVALAARALQIEHILVISGETIILDSARQQDFKSMRKMDYSSIEETFRSLLSDLR